MRGGTSRNRAVGGQKSALGILDDARTVGQRQPARQFSVAPAKILSVGTRDRAYRPQSTRHSTIAETGRIASIASRAWLL
jgi:hypothetical protein